MGCRCWSAVGAWRQGLLELDLANSLATTEHSYLEQSCDLVMVLDGLAPCFSFNEEKILWPTHPNPQSKRVELWYFCLHSVGIIRIYWHGDNCEVTYSARTPSPFLCHIKLQLPTTKTIPYVDSALVYITLRLKLWRVARSTGACTLDCCLSFSFFSDFLHVIHVASKAQQLELTKLASVSLPSYSYSFVSTSFVERRRKHSKMS